ncbi:LPS assembly lipoprotein LptE [Trinickia dinghuensis]|uniref:LPS-assembly lipoprotein LptE n=1 Tax=Trinickia dinghuensis TaxID=2291023 RepID=A0A3D8JPR3_9BURK|nr:LPS assembly lipoprotein LptE [Trinickia dinghuensis]RDU94802.1 lipopolysaccharide-assembly family protein [Trinickia dinghuensis]
MIRRSFLALVCGTAMLAACGFQLRGQENYAFKRLAIVGAPPVVAARLTRMIEGGSDTVVVASPTNADAILTLNEGRGQRQLTLSLAGAIEEYELDYSLGYTLTGTDGTLLIAPSAIELNRALSYNTQYATAKATEADLLYADMQNDAVDQLTRRLATVHSLHPAPGHQTPGVAPRAPLPPPPL